MALDFTMRQGDNLPAFTYTLLYPNGNPVALAGCTVHFHLRKVGNATGAANGIVSVINSSGGQVRYDWGAGDTDEPGEYLAEWEVNFGGGHIETFPVGTYLRGEILPQLA